MPLYAEVMAKRTIMNVQWTLQLVNHKQPLLKRMMENALWIACMFALVYTCLFAAPMEKHTPMTVLWQMQPVRHILLLMWHMWENAHPVQQVGGVYTYRNRNGTLNFQKFVMFESFTSLCLSVLLKIVSILPAWSIKWFNFSISILFTSLVCSSFKYK